MNIVKMLTGKTPGNILAVGSAGAGKSYTLQQLYFLHQMRNVNCCALILNMDYGWKSLCKTLKGKQVDVTSDFTMLGYNGGFSNVFFNLSGLTGFYKAKMIRNILPGVMLKMHKTGDGKAHAIFLDSICPADKETEGIISGCYSMARSYNTSIIGSIQDINENMRFLTKLIANSEIVFLHRLAGQPKNAKKLFHLTATEAEEARQFGIGKALMVAGNVHRPVQVTNLTTLSTIQLSSFLDDFRRKLTPQEIY